MFLSTSLFYFSFYVSIKMKGALTASVQCTKGKEIQIQVLISWHLYSLKYILTCETPSSQNCVPWLTIHV